MNRLVEVTAEEIEVLKKSREARLHAIVPKCVRHLYIIERGKSLMGYPVWRCEHCGKLVYAM